MSETTKIDEIQTGVMYLFHARECMPRLFESTMNAVL